VKKCVGCGGRFPIEAFRWEHKAKGIRKSRCGDCTNARQRHDRITHGEKRRALDRKLYAQNADKVYRQNLRRRYGLTEKQIDFICTSGQCDICGEIAIKRKLVVDHDHKTGANRGVLCGNCNAGLGQFQDRPETLRHAADYLEKGGSGYFGTLEH
jgi:hypothetical protein